MNQYQKAQEDYNLLLPYIRVKEGQQMCKYIFGLILLPVEQNRRKLIDSIEGMNDIVNYFEKPEITPLLLNKFYTIEEGWDKKKEAAAWDWLHSLSFFKRFTPKVIHSFMHKIKIDVVKKGQLLFVNKREGVDQASEDGFIINQDEEVHNISVTKQTFLQRHVECDLKRKVYIVLKGNIAVKDHDDDILLPKTMAKYTEGKNICSYLFIIIHSTYLTTSFRWYNWSTKVRWRIVQ